MIDKKTKRKKKQTNKRSIMQSLSKKELEMSSNNSSVVKIVPPQVHLDIPTASTAIIK